MENFNPLDTFDHVVVLMLENRSFDNLLGHLYGPEKNEEHGIEKIPEGKSFEGLSLDNPISNPVASFWTKHGISETELSNVSVQKASDYHQPFPDPGEVFQHVNTQLFNQIDEANRGKSEHNMESPYNLPTPTPNPAGMQGFVNDYINTLLGMPSGKEAKAYQPPSRKEFEVIMQCFMPDQVPVLSTLAREFAVFDHWFCSVPSQTWCNRAFWHAGTSGGFVNNPAETKWEILDYVIRPTLFSEWKRKVRSKPNLFGRMSAKNVSSCVYATQAVSLTGLINNVPNLDHSASLVGDTNNLDGFKKAIESNTLPQYSFLEPKFMFKHNDQHPSSVDSSVFGQTQPGTVKRGEDLIWEVYNTIFTNDNYKDNTLFIITYDEHGGCFDHVPPISVTPPSAGMKGELGFDFTRSGCRVPMVMVSSHIQKNTIVNETFDHTSFIRTMTKKWDLQPLTDRDKSANSFEQVFSPEKRTSFPQIERPVLEEIDDEVAANMPLNDLQKSILGASHALATETLNLGAEAASEQLSSIQTIGEAMTYLESIRDHLNN